MVITESPKYVSAPKGHELLCKAGVKISKNTYYEQLGKGSIPNIRVGKKFFVREDIVQVMSEN